MAANVASVRAIPGRFQDNNRCRRCHSEIETLAHVLGSCPFGDALLNHRHRTIRSKLAKALQVDTQYMKKSTLKTIMYKKPVRGSLQTSEYLAAIEARNAAYQELDSISIHRGLDDIEKPTFSRSISSSISISRLFGRGKQEAEGRLLEQSEDLDDLDLVVDFGGYSRSKSRDHSQQMTPL
ncbi:hypothetical protein ANN_04981 [Periplaneta americana]|uniref:Uncharacterized protein n=1 Tax=Periplaneta americana TaxID=6978 RepID=A0ABQ8TBL0_PERAM|nr:hypothetical protein ANN_04981 [Periplaneta americana]